MKNFLILLVALMIIVPDLYGQKIGALFVGANNYLVSGGDNEYNINATGLSVGWLIPINISNLNIYYKVKASHHKINEYDRSPYWRKLEYFFSAVNEILIGKRLAINDKVNIIPQIGFGAIGEAAYYDWDKGATHGEAFMDLSFLSTYDMNKLSLGIMINFEKDIIPAPSSIISDKRLNVTLVVGR